MLAFLSANWLWIVLVGGMLFMHLGHGGHGMRHGGHGARSKDAEGNDTGGHGGCGTHTSGEPTTDHDQHHHAPGGATGGERPPKA